MGRLGRSECRHRVFVVLIDIGECREIGVIMRIPDDDDAVGDVPCTGPL